MADVTRISYQTSQRARSIALDDFDRKFDLSNGRISRIAESVFGIGEDAEIEAKLTPDRLTIIHDGETYTIQLKDGQLDSDEADVKIPDETYEDFAFLQTLLKIQSSLTPSVVPTITRSVDGSTVNITINMGGHSQDQSSHDLVRLAMKALERSLEAQQSTNITLSRENGQLREALSSMRLQMDQLQLQQRLDQERHARELQQIRDQTVHDTQAARQLMDQILEQ